MSCRLARGVSVVSLALAMLIAISGGSPNEADAAPSAKKTSRKNQPAPKSNAAPDVTSTIAPAENAKGSPSPGAALPEVEDESIPPAFNLPTASRARMRACGERWQEMKMSGEAKDQTWRAYATRCLASKDGPDKVTRP